MTEIDKKEKRGEPATADSTFCATSSGLERKKILIVDDKMPGKDSLDPAEEEISQSRMRLVEAQALAHLGNWELDLRAKQMVWSDEVFRIFGIDARVFGATYEVFLGAVHPEDRKSVSRAYACAVKKQGPWEIDHRLLMRDGAIKFVHELCETFYDQAGKPIRIVGTVQDITERKRTEAALRESRERLGIALNAAHMGAFDWDILNNYITWPYWHEELWEFKPGEFNGSYDKLLQRVHPDDQSGVNTEVSRCIAAHEPFEREFRVVWSDGGVHWLACTGRFIFDEVGRAVEMRGVVQDITVRKHVEENLRRQTAITKTINRVLLETLASETEEDVARTCLAVAEELTGSRFGWIGVVNPSGRLDTLAMSDPGREFCAITEAQISMIRNLEIRGIFGRVLKDGKALITNEPASHPDSVGLPDGHPELTAFLGVPLKDDDRTIGMVALANKSSGYAMHDCEAIEALTVALVEVLKRKRAEVEHERLIAAIEQVGEMVVITDPTGTIQYINPAFETMTGYTRQEALGQSPRILKSGKQDKGFYRELWETISSRLTWTGRFVNRRKDGTLYNEAATISPVCDASGRIINYIAVKRDITENLRLQAEFRQAQKMESVGRLAGGVAHDYNNMLSVILGYAELALANVDPGEPIYADLQEIQKAGRRSAAITRQLLAFARKQTISPEVLDLNDTVEGMLKMLRRLIGEDIDLLWMPGSDLWPVKMDPAQIDQILANLCVNARDAVTGVGKVTIETDNVSFDVAYCSIHEGFVPGDFVRLSVSDNGCGMDKDVQKHLFEPFFTTKAVGQGTGLGLATVYGIVKQNEGFINVYSELGTGTALKIYLPRHGSPAAGAAESATEIPLSRGETVLLVEDDPMVLQMGKMMLERLGYGVLAADGADEAVRLAVEHAREIHLLMTDVVMPAMNGWDLAKRLMSLYPHLKCLFMSGYTANAIAHDGVLDDGVHFIQKPFSLDALAAMVRKVLGVK